METKELVIDILNAAIDAFASNGHKVYPGDKVVDYNVESVRIAPYGDRHPGWIKLFVTLEEGSGLFFLSSKLTMTGNVYYVAWEEDNGFHSVGELLRRKHAALRRTDRTLYYKYLDQAEAEIEGIIVKGLFK